MANRKPTPEDAAHINFRLPADEAERLRKLAEAQDRSISAEVRRAIKAHVDAQLGEAA